MPDARISPRAIFCWRVGGAKSGRGVHYFLSLTFINLERNPCSRVVALLCARGGNAVLSRNYLTRQASMLLKFAKATTDPNIAAALFEKAADLKSRVDDSGAPDPAPHAPDIEAPK
jgi:hypothetical protein